MKQTVLIKSIIVIAFLFIKTPSFSQYHNNDIIKQAQKLLEKNYIFLDKAKETNAHLDVLMKKGFFDEKSPIDFAKTLTLELRKITKDKHLYFSNPRVNKGEKKTERSITENLARYKSPMLRGFKFLEDNIGYIDLAFFGGSEEHLAKIDFVMKEMQIADAIIIDLRRNGGGYPTTVNYLSSYFFSEKILLNSIYSRAQNHTEEFWVVDVNGVKRPKVPVYILTSTSTFSGAEDFSYTMQSRSRATIIGEVTGGGAHPTQYFPLDQGFGIGIPFARTINTVTKTNWEGVGVQPDIKMSADDALEKAKELAIEEASKYKNSFFKPLENALIALKEKNKTDENNNNVYKQLELLVKANILGEGSVNEIGYSYIQSKKPKIAQVIFKSNTLMFPDSANAWDSLAESYLNLDNKEKAIEYYNKAIKLDPEGSVGDNARTMLKKLQQKL